MPDFTVTITNPVISTIRREFPTLTTDAQAAQKLVDVAITRLGAEYVNRHREANREAYRQQWAAATPAQRTAIRTTLGLTSNEDP